MIYSKVPVGKTYKGMSIFNKCTSNAISKRFFGLKDTNFKYHFYWLDITVIDKNYIVCIVDLMNLYLW